MGGGCQWGDFISGIYSISLFQILNPASSLAGIITLHNVSIFLLLYPTAAWKNRWWLPRITLSRVGWDWRRSPTTLRESFQKDLRSAVIGHFEKVPPTGNEALIACSCCADICAGMCRVQTAGADRYHCTFQQGNDRRWACLLKQ